MLCKLNPLYTVFDSTLKESNPYLYYKPFWVPSLIIFAFFLGAATLGYRAILLSGKVFFTNFGRGNIHHLFL